jgi:AbiU2
MNDPKTVLHGFYDLCVEARSDFDLYRSLFEDDPTSTELCVNYAPYFFNDFGRIITRALVLHACKLTDPAGTAGKTNLTTNYILEELPWPANVKDELNRLSDRLMAFRDKVKAARNKRIAHADLHSQVQHLEAMGAFNPGEDLKFFEDLQSFVEVAFRHVFGDPAPTIRIGASTDTYKVIRAVEKAILYDRCPRCTAAQRANDVLDFEGH